MTVEKPPESEELPRALTAPLPSRDSSDQRARGAGKPCRSGPPGNGNARTHGAYTLRAAVKELGSRAVDRRTKTGRALAAWRSEIAGDLGGLDALSAQQRAVLEEAVKLKLMLDSVDAWILAQPSLVDRRKRALLPVVRERQSLADALVRYLTTLGLERRVRELPDLASYISTRTPPATSDGQREGDGARGREAGTGARSDAAAENEPEATLEPSDARHAPAPALDARSGESTA